MRVAILTFVLTVLTLGASGYPLPRIGGEGSVDITSGATLDQAPALMRRKYLTSEPGPGSPGYGIGVSAGQVDPIEAPAPGIQPATPVVPNPQPVVNPQVNAQPPVSPQPVTPETPSVNQNPVPIPVKPDVSAIQQIRQLDCQMWFYGGQEFNARPWYCRSGSPGVIGN